MEIRPTKKRMLKIVERNEREARNTLTLVKSCLESKDLGGARDAIRSIRGEYRKPAIEIFKDHKPDSEKCQECGSELKWIFIDYLIDWQKQLCLTCDYNKVKAVIKDKSQKIMEHRGIPKRYLNASLSDFPKNFRQQVRKNSGAFLWGAPGTGKTHLMAAKMREEILNTEPRKCWVTERDGQREGYEEPFDSDFPLFVSVPELLLKLRATFRNSSAGTSEQEILEMYTKAKLLFLDDLGTEKPTDWALQTLYLLIDRRYSEMLRTIISSNLSLDALAGHLDDRISSRIAGMCQVLHMTGKDRRLSK